MYSLFLSIVSLSFVSSHATQFDQVKDVSRVNCKGVVAASLDEVRNKAADKFGKSDMPNIHLDTDGTEIDDEDYFQTLEPNTELIAVFAGEQWTDVSKNAYYFCGGFCFVFLSC